MKKRLFIALCLLCLVASAPAFGAPPAKTQPALIKATEMAIRGGLPNVAAKLQQGKPVTVLFIGGSITEGGRDYGFSARIPQWIQAQYPKAKVTGINAGIGGTQSWFGVMRYQHDVLSKKPDLVFIEFAVNDRGDRSKSMERMVRQTWEKSPETDICFIYTLHKRHLEYYQKGQFPPSASSHERVAQVYGIPTVGMSKVVADLYNAGKLDWKNFANDDCHPNRKGYVYFIDTIKKALTESFQTGQAGAHVLPQETLTPNLVVWEPKAIAQPLPKAEPFVDSAGQKAKITFTLPTPGVHWVDSPDYRVNKRTTWKIRYQRKIRKDEISPKANPDRQAWKTKPEWLDPRRGFIDPDVGQIFGKSRHGASFGSTKHYRPVLIFVAPKTGRYAFSATAGRAYSYNSPDRQIYLNAVYFPKANTRGRSLKAYQNQVKNVKDMALAGETRMAAGDELAFVLNETSVYGTTLTDFQMSVGYFAK